jgi:RNA polymerase sigma factor (sigma-70 family)
MPTSHLNRIVPHFRRAVLRRDGGGMTDGQLLKCFIDELDDSAFEALVHRHGPMVLGVCRRVLRNDHDAEDAYQATFLVLVRKAATIVPREMVGNWLYGVAYQTASRARAVAAKRWVRERQVEVMPETKAAAQDCRHELQAVLDQELSRLPAKYRIPIVLCGLEEKSHKDAARQLGWPQGTLSVRLARARKMLADRLARRGIMLSGGLMTALSPGAASACVPHALFVGTARAAKLLSGGQVMPAGMVPAGVIALTDGVVKAMLLTRLKLAATVLLAVAILGTGAGLFVRRAPAGQVASDKAQDGGEKGSKNKSSAVKPDIGNRAQRYTFRCKIVEIRADGEEVRVAEPTIVTLEGQSASLLSGGTVAIEGVKKEGEAAESEEFGLRLDLRVETVQKGTVRLHARFEQSELEKDKKGNGVRIPGRYVRAVETVRLGDTVRLTLKDDQGSIRRRAEIKVEAAPDR